MQMCSNKENNKFQSYHKINNNRNKLIIYPTAVDILNTSDFSTGDSLMSTNYVRDPDLDNVLTNTSFNLMLQNNLDQNQ